MQRRFVLGLIIIVFGVLVLLNQLEQFSLGSFLSVWWPMVLILAGVYQLFSRSVPVAGSVIILLIGAWFQARNLDLISGSIFRYFWPVVIILVGCWFLFTRVKTAADADDVVRHFALFSGISARSVSKHFKGGSVTALFGGADLDLTEAEIEGNAASMDLTAMFGGIDIYVPEHWVVKVTGLPIFGGWGNKTKSRELPEDSFGKPGPVIQLRCFVAFGGIDIKNRPADKDNKG